MEYMSISIAEYKKLQKAGGNKKVKNATKSVVDGISFDSNLEKWMYGLLKGAGIAFEFQKVYVIQNKFKYGREAIRDIKSIVDFYLPVQNIIIDTKGYSNDVAPIKYKMLKKVLNDEAKNQGVDPPIIIMPKNKKECDQLLNKILYAPDLNQ